MAKIGFCLSVCLINVLFESFNVFFGNLFVFCSGSCKVSIRTISFFLCVSLVRV